MEAPDDPVFFLYNNRTQIIKRFAAFSTFERVEGGVELFHLDLFCGAKVSAAATLLRGRTALRYHNVCMYV